jgi:hypothetical protein
MKPLTRLVSFGWTLELSDFQCLSYLSLILPLVCYPSSSSILFPFLTSVEYCKHSETNQSRRRFHPGLWEDNTTERRYAENPKICRQFKPKSQD